MIRTAKIVFALLWVAILPALAQGEGTPYSMYGYGILGDRATSMQRQMGSVGVAMNSGRQVNVMNPASYAATDSLTFLFDIGADVSMIWREEGDKKKYATGGGVDYVTMQFPMGKYFGGSIGLLPYSSVGYAFGNEIKHGTMENQGSGGINELYLGLAGGIKGFSLGFNIAYSFGNIVNDVFSTPEGYSQTKFEHLMKIRDWNLVVGAQYTFRPNRFNKFVVGVTYSPKKTLLGNATVTSQNLASSEANVKPETISEMKLRDNYYTPNIIGAGLSYTYEKSYRVSAEVDFVWQGWKDCKYSEMRSTAKPEQIAFAGMTFNNRTKYAAGLDFTPRIRGNYGQRMSYRIGGYYINDYLKVRGNDVKEYGVTCGFGFPTPEGRTMVNLGLEWKHRQSSPVNYISENYFNVSLGVNFNEVWFFKRRIR